MGGKTSLQEAARGNLVGGRFFFFLFFFLAPEVGLGRAIVQELLARADDRADDTVVLAVSRPERKPAELRLTSACTGFNSPTHPRTRPRPGSGDNNSLPSFACRWQAIPRTLELSSVFVFNHRLAARVRAQNRPRMAARTPGIESIVPPNSCQLIS